MVMDFFVNSLVPTSPAQELTSTTRLQLAVCEGANRARNPDVMKNVSVELSSAK